jgi:heme exporter protein C
MRTVFYPAVIGWTLLGVWISTLKIRYAMLAENKFNND